MNKAETRAEHIDPALKAAGWGVVEGSRVKLLQGLAEKSDLFDVLAHVAYARPPLTHEVGAANAAGIKTIEPAED